jgi:hypothetical protein
MRESLLSAGAVGCSRVGGKTAMQVGGADVADRDPDTIKQEIDAARDQLAATVDSLAERANPSRIADDVKAGLVRFVKKPPVAITLAGLATVVLVVVFRRIKNR